MEKVMDRGQRIQALVEHAKNPRFRGEIGRADVEMPGGSPECGGSVVVYLKGDGNGSIEDISWTGQGDTISMGATSMVLEKVHEEGLNMQEVLDMDYEEIMQTIGRDIIGTRTRNATLGLSTLKAAVRKYQRDKNGR